MNTSTLASPRSGAKTSAAVKSKTRLFHLDNLRIFLTVLVILHHAAIAYGGAGDWAVSDPATDELSPILLSFFNALNQSYFMSMFFLLAGYFTPRSYDKKGAAQFLKDRLIRLGIPLLVYTTIIWNLNGYIVDVMWLDRPFTTRVGYNPGHLWFLQALLLFAVVYAAYRLWSDRNPNKYFQYLQNRFPSNSFLVGTITVLAVLTFLVRIIVPVGVWVFGLQLGHFVHYVFAFFVGILAQRGDWFNRLQAPQAKQWGRVALVWMPLFFVVAIAGGALEGDLSKFVGGVHWQSAAYSLWESVMFIAVTVFLLWFFREKLASAGSAAQSMSGSVYTVYIIHQTVLIFFNILFLSVPIPSPLKFVAVSVIVVPLCFALSVPIRKIPFADRVLG